MDPKKNASTALVVAKESRLPVPAEEKKESYWGRMAAHFTLAWRLMLAALLLFAVLFVLLFSRAFTYDSLFCFIRDLQAVSDFVPNDYATVTAPYEQGDHTAIAYRGGVAFVNSGGVEVYSPNGERLLNLSRKMKNPRAVASRKYLLAYDNGGTSFSITNSYTELFRGESEYPIYGATVSDSGHFALITASGEALSQVLLYDNNFNLVQRFQRASATVGVDLSDNGKRIALLGMSATDGTVRSVVNVYLLGESEPEGSCVFENEVPMAVSFIGNRHYTVFTASALRCLDLDGEVRNTVALQGATPVGFAANKHGVLIALETDAINATHRILALDKKGNILYDGTYDRDVTAVEMGKKEIFLLSEGTVTRIDTDDGASTSSEIETGATGMYRVDDGAVRVVYPAKAVYVAFS